MRWEPRLMTKPGTRRRWSDLSRVERVGAATRASPCTWCCWASTACCCCRSRSISTSAAEAIALLAGGLAVSALGLAVAMPVLRRYPAVHPLPWRRDRGAAGRLRRVLRGRRHGVVGRRARGRGRDGRRRDDDPDARAAARHAARARAGGARRAAVRAISGGEARDALPGVLFAVTFLVTARASMWLLGIVTDLDGRAARRRASWRWRRSGCASRATCTTCSAGGSRRSRSRPSWPPRLRRARRRARRRADAARCARVAHEALREARELARGYRAGDFLQELEGARSLLRSAEHRGPAERRRRCRAPGMRPPAGSCCESVTNILRHSERPLRRDRLRRRAAAGRERRRAARRRRRRRRRRPARRCASGSPRSAPRWRPGRRTTTAGPSSRSSRPADRSAPPTRQGSRMSTPIRILLADDEHLIRTALAQMLDLEDDLDVVAEAVDGRRAPSAARSSTPSTSPCSTCRCRSSTGSPSPSG